MHPLYINIHTHHPVGRGIELRVAGVHPWDAEQAAKGVRADRTQQAKQAPADKGPQSPHIQQAAPAAEVQAIGEIGLDYACTVDRTAQMVLFRAQLRLARERGLPVVLHCVRAFEPIMRELTACEPRAVIFHGFIGSPEQAQRAIDRGYYLSFGERAFVSPRTVEALRSVPLSQLFLETDDSEVAIEQIYARTAEIRSMSIEELQRMITENYERIFTSGPMGSESIQHHG